jgi:glucose/arabinose dehydrogenase
MTDQRDADPRLVGYSTPQEIKLELVAENHQPRAHQIAIAPDGTLLLLQPGEVPAPSKLARTPPAVTPGKGQPYELTSVKRWVFNSKSWEAVGLLREPGRATFLQDGSVLFTASNGNITRRRLNQVNSTTGAPELLVHGLAERTACYLAFDPMGFLSIAVGPGAHNVVGSDGSKAQALDTGAVFRCRPDGSKVELVATGISNPTGPVIFDRNAYAFLVDSVRSGQGFVTRLLHVTEGSDYGFRSLSKSQPDLNDYRRWTCLRDLPGIMKPLLSIPGRGAGGACIYDDTRFPPLFQGLLLYPSPDSHSVKALRLERRGSSFAVTEAFDLVRSTDANFTPWQVLIGPDGAIYVLDNCLHHSPATEPFDWRADKGRLFRLSWKGGPASPGIALKSASSWSTIAPMNGAQLINALAAAEGTDRQLAQRELIRRGKINQAALLKSVANVELGIDARALAAGALCTLWDESVKKAFIALATDDETVLRRLAAKSLGRLAAPGDPQVQEVLLHILGDADPATRRSVALAMARANPADAAGSIATSLTFDIGTDPNLRDGLVRALERTGKPGLDELLKLAESGEADRLELAVNSFCALRTELPLERLPQLLNSPHLDAAARVRLIRSLARYPALQLKDVQPVLVWLVQKHPADLELWRSLALVLGVQYGKFAGGLEQFYFLLIK